jgi:hypothetical protein
MRASQTISLVAGLVLVTVRVQQVSSRPILEANWKQSEVDSLQMYKRAKSNKIHPEGVAPTPPPALPASPPASHLKNANSHLSTSAAHIAVGVSKIATLPAAGIFNSLKSLAHTPRDLVRLHGTDFMVNGLSGLIVKPGHTILETVAQPIQHAGQATAHLGYAVKGYAKALTSGNKDSRRTERHVHERHTGTWKKAYRGPFKHAGKNLDDIGDDLDRFGFEHY